MGETPKDISMNTVHRVVEVGMWLLTLEHWYINSLSSKLT
jgi:hypothetical protein